MSRKDFNKSLSENYKEGEYAYYERLRTLYASAPLILLYGSALTDMSAYAEPCNNVSCRFPAGYLLR